MRFDGIDEGGLMQHPRTTWVTSKEDINTVHSSYRLDIYNKD